MVATLADACNGPSQVPSPSPPIAPNTQYGPRPMFRRALNVRRWGGRTGRVYYSCNPNKSSLHSLPFQYSARTWAGPRAPNLRSFCANLAPLPPFYQQGGAGGRPSRRGRYIFGGHIRYHTPTNKINPTDKERPLALLLSSIKLVGCV